MINEFAFIRAERMEFPLHYFIFRQTASHLPHEGNVEQISSPSPVACLTQTWTLRTCRR